MICTRRGKLSSVVFAFVALASIVSSPLASQDSPESSPEAITHHARAIVLDLATRYPDLQAQDAKHRFVRVEYWECPKQNIGPLEAAVDSIWGPIFDEMTAEGRFLSWSSQRPIQALEFNFLGDRATQEEVAPSWQWVFVWSAPTQAAFEAEWQEFVRRLRARFPDDPRPARFCGDLTKVDYVEHRRR